MKLFKKDTHYLYMQTCRETEDSCENINVDVVMCLKGSDENDEHNHLVISDLVSILRFEKSG